MGTLCLVRHGQASYGAADYDRLSERGIAQAQALGRRWAADRIAADAVVSGPMRRQRDTLTIACEAAAAAGHPLPAPTVLDELAEYPAFELLARFLPRFAPTAPVTRADLHDLAFKSMLDAWCSGELDTEGLETFTGFVARVRAGLQHLFSAHPGRGRRIIAVTSGGPIGVAGKLALGLDPMATLRLWRMVRNASVTELMWRSDAFTWAAGDLSLLGFNHVDHLPADLVTYR